MLRRDFLKMAGLVMAAPNISFGFDDQKHDESVILIFLGGGISHIEFANPIPDAPTEFRSVRGATKTKSGFLLGGDFTGLAELSDQLTVVRTINTKNADHQSATVGMMTGHLHVNMQPQKEPSFGSVLGHQFGTNAVKGMPTYVKIDKIEGDDASWLGAKYNGYDLDQAGVANLFPRIPMERFNTRIGFMQAIDKKSQDPLSKSWGEVKEQAVNIITGDVSKAFELDKEPAEYKLAYDITKNNFGKNCLLARRLVDSGAKFVTLTHGNWDMHNDINAGFAARAPELDKYVSTLIQDLKARGRNTLVVLFGEFSRTPRINVSSGRDHFSLNNTAIFAGGNYNHGKVIGTTDKTASSTVDKEIYLKDIYKTVLGHFNINHLTIKDNQQRPRHVVDETATNLLV